MPRRPKRGCSAPGCPELVPSEERFCPEHQKQRDQEYEAQRGTPAERGYDARWRKVRRMYLRRHPYCADPFDRHEFQGKRVKATHVHHIQKLDEGGTHAFENLEALCASCHSTHHAKEGDRWG